MLTFGESIEYGELSVRLKGLIFEFDNRIHFLEHFKKDFNVVLR